MKLSIATRVHVYTYWAVRLTENWWHPGRNGGPSVLVGARGRFAHAEAHRIASMNVSPENTHLQVIKVRVYRVERKAPR